MDRAAFTANSPGQLASIEGGQVAFLPNELPPDLSRAMTPDVILAIAEAEAELGRLDGLAGTLPDPELLIAPFLRREALESSRIEGTQTTAQDLLIYEAQEDSEIDPDAREVDNYIRALRHGLARINEVPLGKTLFNEMHALLMNGTNPEETFPGQFRQTQVYVAAKGAPIAEARYVPPPAHFVDHAFDNLADYLATGNQVPLLVRLAIAHYQFEAIHPFKDGNGRLGRLLIVLMLCRAKKISAPMLYLSAYFERRRTRYYDSMLRVSTVGGWEQWILFFLRGIAIQAKDAAGRTRELQALRESYRARLSGARKATSALVLVDELFKFPLLTNRIAQSILSFSWQAANENIRKLLDAGIVRSIERRGKRTIFVAHEIADIIDRAEAGAEPAEPAQLTLLGTSGQG